jgi:hypothetical protein
MKVLLAWCQVWIVDEKGWRCILSKEIRFIDIKPLEFLPHRLFDDCAKVANVR